MSRFVDDRPVAQIVQAAPSPVLARRAARDHLLFSYALADKFEALAASDVGESALFAAETNAAQAARGLLGGLYDLDRGAAAGRARRLEITGPMVVGVNELKHAIGEMSALRAEAERDPFLAAALRLEVAEQRAMADSISRMIAGLQVEALDEFAAYSLLRDLAAAVQVYLGRFLSVAVFNSEM